MPTAFQIRARAFVDRMIGEELAQAHEIGLTLDLPDPFHITDPCPYSQTGHDPISSCGHVVCCHCSKVFG